MMNQVGMLLNRKTYPFIEYIEAALITLGVAMFTLTEKSPSTVQSERFDTSYGVILLAVYLVCDSITSQWQSKVYKQFSVDQYQMMLGVNIWSMVMTGITLYNSGEFLTSLAFIMADSSAFLHMLILSVTSATGQLFIFYTIKEFGPVIFTIIMTTRQIFSLFLSCLLFTHKLGVASIVSALLVFLIVINRIYRKGTD
jgi:adenosine 3'-phospho 5'-phosphosulfate transporter B2